MVPLEAQACGRPVIAYGAGGSLETVRGTGPRRTGLYFAEQTPESAAGAIRQWEAEQEARFNPEWSREWAGGFATAHFLAGYREFVLQHVPQAAPEMLSVADALKAVIGGPLPRAS